MQILPVLRRRTGRALMILLGLLAMTVLSLAAVAEDSSLSDVERRLKQLEEEVDRLKSDNRQLKATVENQQPLAGWQNGFYLQSADGSYRLKIEAYTQADGHFFIDDRENRNVNEFLFRRARINLEGTVLKYFDFKFMPDFAGGKAVLFDAYVDVNYVPEAELRVGKFKPPLGLERLQSARTLMFVDRGLPTNLVPVRDNGVQLFGALWSGVLSYEVGVFNGAPDLGNPDVDVNDDKDFVGRLFAMPFKTTAIAALQGLGVGVASSYGRERGNQSSPDTPTFRTFGQATFFSYKSDSTDATKTVVAFGPHTRISPQGYYYFGPFGLLTNYVVSEQRMHLNNKFATFNNNAWQIAASYVLTGEAASYAGVVPAQPFDPWRHTWGAFEVAARYCQLTVDSDAFTMGFADPTKSARRDNEWVLGVNWYLNRNLKLVLNYGNSDFKAGSPAGNRSTEKAILTRVQLVI